MTTRPTVHWMGLTRETWSQKPKEPGRLTSDLWQKSCPWTKPTKPCSDSHSWIKWWTTGEQTVMSAHVCSSVCPWGSADSSVCPWGSADGNAWCFTYRAYLEVLTVTAQEHVWWTSWHTTDICTGWGRHTYKRRTSTKKYWWVRWHSTRPTWTTDNTGDSWRRTYMNQARSLVCTDTKTHHACSKCAVKCHF